jgi:hypothetical protein
MSGIKQKSVESGQRKISSTTEKKCSNTTTRHADGVVNRLQLDSVTGLLTATEHANFKQYKQMLLNRKNLPVSGAVINSDGTEKRQDVAKNAAIIYLCEKKDRQSIPTYNLEVEKTHNFLANGVVVHNCLDLLNQLSEMDLYAPTGSEELVSSMITADGLIWTSVWGDEDESDGYANNVIF